MDAEAIHETGLHTASTQSTARTCSVGTVNELCFTALLSPQTEENERLGTVLNQGSPTFLNGGPNCQTAGHMKQFCGTHVAHRLPTNFKHSCTIAGPRLTVCCIRTRTVEQ